MGEVKIEFKLGAIEFKGEGNQDWVSKQLDKILEKAPNLLKVAPKQPPASPGVHPPVDADPNIAKQQLATFLKSKNANKSPKKKFLATAIWLHAKGSTKLKTGDVSKALKDNKQSKLSNPAVFLSNNIADGFCEGGGKEFFVTDEGENSL